MFWRIYRTKIKCLLHKRACIFWNLCFPIILSTVIALSVHTMQDKVYHSLRVAIVTEGNKSKDCSIVKAMKGAKYKDEIAMFNVIECGLCEAAALLHTNQVVGYIIVSDVDSFLVKSNGLSQTIIQSFVDQYKQFLRTCLKIKKMHPEVPMEELSYSGQITTQFIQEETIPNKLDNTVIYFYALIAMACMFSAQFGILEVTNIQADQSDVATRINCAPVSKTRLYLCSVLAAFTVCFCMIATLIMYIKYILNVGFDKRDCLLLGIGALGVLTGICIGAFMGVLLKEKNVLKETVMMGAVLFFSFLSGALVVQVKYYVIKKVPLLSYINPANLIADSFYCLYYDHNYQRFFINASILLAICTVLGSVSILMIRRRTYAYL